jgi:hypothetical protein
MSKSPLKNRNPLLVSAINDGVPARRKNRNYWDIVDRVRRQPCFEETGQVKDRCGEGEFQQWLKSTLTSFWRLTP